MMRASSVSAALFGLLPLNALLEFTRIMVPAPTAMLAAATRAPITREWCFFIRMIGYVYTDSIITYLLNTSNTFLSLRTVVSAVKLCGLLLCGLDDNQHFQYHIHHPVDEECGEERSAAVGNTFKEEPY